MWQFSLNILLIFFNDPLCLWRDKLGMFYSVQQSLMESGFITCLLFFWLLLMHAMIYQDTVISFEQFFFPKMILGGAFLIYLVVMRLFVYIKYSQDPFFDVVEARHLSNFYGFLQSVGVVLIFMYAFYFGMITIRATQFIKTMRETHRYSVGVTILVMVVSSVIMVRNGQAS